jgi:hypothetical protein
MEKKKRMKSYRDNRVIISYKDSEKKITKIMMKKHGRGIRIKRIFFIG